MGRLRFTYRGAHDRFSIPFTDPIRIQLHRRSGVPLELPDRFGIPESEFLPVIDITSMIMPGHLRWYQSRGSFVFTASQTMQAVPVHIHWDSGDFSEDITAVYVGVAGWDVHMKAVFLLVDHLGHNQHRLIGNYSTLVNVGGIHEWRRRHGTDSAKAVLQTLDYGREWVLHTLTLV